MLNKKEIILGSRNSLLAKIQTKLAISKLKEVGVNNLKTKFLKSKGDNLRSKLFKDLGGKGLFTKEIDNLVINEDIDLGVHSAKDIPAFLDRELTIGAFLEREDVRDVLITKDSKIKNINHLPINCLLGSSSPRRTSYINNYRPDIKIIPIRGNIETRIKNLKNNKLQAIVIALAGVIRLNKKYKNLSFNAIPLTQILPSPGQGAIAIVYKKGNLINKKICDLIDNHYTRYALLAERALIKKINGDCFTPIAAYAKIYNRKLVLKARLFSNDGKKYIDKRVEGSILDARKIGIKCARHLTKNLPRK